VQGLHNDEQNLTERPKVLLRKELRRTEFAEESRTLLLQPIQYPNLFEPLSHLGISSCSPKTTLDAASLLHAPSSVLERQVWPGYGLLCASHLLRGRSGVLNLPVTTHEKDS
jgi:hypothetical protein